MDPMDSASSSSCSRVHTHKADLAGCVMLMTKQSLTMECTCAGANDKADVESIVDHRTKKQMCAGATAKAHVEHDMIVCRSQ